ncbi:MULTISPECIES: AAA family ATPase [unclassified Rhizobium]|uniref:ATP-dependent nuclease n=1 Tax=unclassified Rhizobium TaxID=2613769 RepID=UPI0017E3645E|nr:MULTISPECIES: AAA family ATPase [unclassified Rhizobium]MBB3394207.1 hypothetical protein [Rhizobium sp. BK060]MBB4169698.1 hypothetical protein [Rhizobium sp. BK538]
MEGYGVYLRGYDSAKQELEDEPGAGLETVLSLNMRVESDLEPVWTLVSDRAQAAGLTRNLSWSDRTNLAPVRIGALSDNNLAWRRGSILNRLSDESADASTALLEAARAARKSFGVDADKKLGKALDIVTQVAGELGIDVGAKARAELEAHSVSVAAGTISLHSETGVPLRRLGLGSTRLMISGLQQKSASESAVLLVDELEHGLEPHRIIQFLHNLGAKNADTPLQVFLTSHSPIAVRELTVEQLWIVRRSGGKHEIRWVGDYPDLQGTLRAHPDAFLARSILVCEGASEVGLVRGIDQNRHAAGKASMYATGTVLVDAGGCDKILGRALAFQTMGYRVATFRDDDVKPNPGKEAAFEVDGGEVFKWRDGNKLEVELFGSLPENAVNILLEKVLEDRSETEINDQLSSRSGNAVTLAIVRDELGKGVLSGEARKALGEAAGGNSEGKKAWFKSVGAMEEIGREVVIPHLLKSDVAFKDVIVAMRKWCVGA